VSEQPSEAFDAQREVETLHEFFVSWFLGECSNDQETFSRLETVLSDDFELTTREGRIVPRDELVKSLRRHHASAEGNTFRIWVKELRSRPLGDGLHVVTYQEWQERNEGTTKLQSSAVMRESADTPNGLEWMHLHESPLA
jgi:hypothetical protein